jgi:hypothetical protein
VPAKSGTTEAADIRGLKPLEAFQYPFYYYVGGVLLGLLGIALISWAVRKFLRRKKEKVTPSLPQELLHVVILRRLEALKTELATTSASLKLIHFGLSETFRDYLEGRFHFSASDWTTEEILAYLRNNSSLIEDADTIRRILIKTDEVKFAGSQTDASQLLALLQESIDFVEKTYERPMLPVEATP